MKPNLFIIGAPKAGTTSIAAYLADHPDVCFSTPKEPFYWATDIPRTAHDLKVESLEQYLGLFKTDGKEYKVLAEGSTIYLRSTKAVENILKFNPDAKFITILRNPAEVAYAYHMEQVYCHNEPEKDFKKAWELKAERLKGNSLPDRCRSPECLQYGEIPAYYEQIKRLINVCPKDQYKIIIFDDFKRDVASVYADVLSFVGLAHDGRIDFPVENSSHNRRFTFISEFMMNPPKILEQPILNFRQRYWGKKNGLIPYVKSKFNVKKEREKLAEATYNELVDYFCDDIQMLENILDQKLALWKTKK
jgi:hypothetical protein